MTRTNHRLHALVPSRRTAAAYGRDEDLRAMAYFDYKTHSAPVFGKRKASGLQACAASCGHPACKNGCTLIGRMD